MWLAQAVAAIGAILIFSFAQIASAQVSLLPPHLQLVKLFGTPNRELIAELLPCLLTTKVPKPLGQWQRRMGCCVFEGARIRQSTHPAREG
jgi:hypothetical protein